MKNKGIKNLKKENLEFPQKLRFTNKNQVKLRLNQL